MTDRLRAWAMRLSPFFLPLGGLGAAKAKVWRLRTWATSPAKRLRVKSFALRLADASRAGRWRRRLVFVPRNPCGLGTDRGAFAFVTRPRSALVLGKGQSSSDA